MNVFDLDLTESQRMMREACRKFVDDTITPFVLKNWKNENYIDEIAAKKFKELGLQPVAVCDDSTFIRRAFLDAIGTLPTKEEAEKFLASNDPNKRKKLIDQLPTFLSLDNNQNVEQFLCGMRTMEHFYHLKKDNEVKQCFKRFDLDGNGYIDK